MSKLINDTLKKPSGKWDKQAITFFVSFFITCALSILTFILSYFFMTKNETALSIIDSFMILTGGLSGSNIFNKLADSKVKTEIPPTE